jgi:Arc/MetJ family transcription regulator
MRTTVTLDPDVEALVLRAMKERGLSFKEAVNSAVRAGLTQSKGKKRPFVQKTFSLGAEQNFRWDKALAASDAIEDEELSRKLALRK